MTEAEGNMCDAAMRGVDAPSWSKTSSRTKGSCRNLGDLAWPAVAQAIPGRDGKSEWTTPSWGTSEVADRVHSTDEALAAVAGNPSAAIIP